MDQSQVPPKYLLVCYASACDGHASNSAYYTHLEVFMRRYHSPPCSLTSKLQSFAWHLMNSVKWGAHSHFYLIHQYHTKPSFLLRMSPRKLHLDLLAFGGTMSSGRSVVKIDRLRTGLIGGNLRTPAVACNWSSWHSYLDVGLSGYGPSHYLSRRYRPLFSH